MREVRNGKFFRGASGRDGKGGGELLPIDYEDSVIILRRIIQVIVESYGRNQENITYVCSKF